MTRIYKPGRKANIITQKMISVRLDLDLIDFLSLKKNKGRYINDLIRNDMLSKNEM